MMCGSLLLAALITLVNATPDVTRRTVTVSYEVDEECVVTFDVLRDGASIGGEYLKETSGDVCKLIPSGSHEFVWYADVGWCDNVALGAVEIKLEAWKADNPPPYMVCDLVTGARRYYPHAEALPGPGGVTNEQYKVSKLVMRKIPAKGVQWRMGRITGEASYSSADEAQHYVKMTNDYYIGVYEFTYGQKAYASGEAITADLYSKMTLPMSNVTWYTTRASSDAGSMPGSSSLLGKLRSAMKGSIEFDLPTDEQWEYASRSCCGQAFANGTMVDSDGEMGWYKENSQNTTHPVGLKKANAWGLYDMHGNVWEWCLDGIYTPEQESSVIESLHGPTTANKVSRGGCFRHETSKYCRSAIRLQRSNSATQMDQGFRVACPAIAK